jgi:sugar phosphate permease
MTGPPPARYAPLPVALGIWALAAALYLLAFFHRLVPAVLTEDLMRNFGLTAATLGQLSALYFYAYVPLQIPFGAAADAFGPRRVLTAGACIAAAGAVLFAASEHVGIAGAGRFLIGAGVGVAFVCMLKLASRWFAPDRFAMLAGCSLLCGVLGAVGAGAPMRWLSVLFGWRAVVLVTAALTAAIAVASWLRVRDDPRACGYRSHAERNENRSAPYTLAGGIAVCLRSRNILLIFLVSAGVSGAPLTFAGLWGVPFLNTHYGYTTAQAGALASLVLVAWAAPSPLLGLLSDRMRRRKPLYAGGALVSLLAWAGVVLIPALPRAALVALLCIAGVAAASVMLGFAYAKESTPAALAGTTTGIVNMGNMLGAMLMQPAVGWVLDRCWEGASRDGVRVYGFEAYRAGFSLLLAWLVLSAVLVLLTRETHCRQQG